MLGRFQNFPVPILKLRTTFGFGFDRFFRIDFFRFRFQTVLAKILISVPVFKFRFYGSNGSAKKAKKCNT